MTDLKRDADRPMPDVVGILPLRGTVLFPQAVVPLGAGRASSVRLIEEALQGGRLVGAVTQKDPADDAPGADGLHSIGTLTVIHKALKQPDGTLRLVAQGVGRFRLLEIIQTEPYLKARIEAIEERAPAEDVELEALVRSVTSLFSKVVSLSPALPDELVGVLANVEGAGAIADMVAASFPSLPIALKQELLETVNVRERLTKLAAALGKEAEVLELGSKIQSEIQSEMTRTQRDYYLREQMKAIQKELGEGDERTQEIDALRAKIEAAGMSDEAKAEALRELDRLAKMPPAAAEYTVARTYIDWLVAMPWQQETTDAVDIAPARVILDEDHEGLEKVKDRILEYLAVKKIRPSGKDPILCFVGPPGVGKTSLVSRSRGRSAASSTASRSAACVTRRRSAGTGARTSARCPARSCRDCGAQARRTPCSCSTRSTSSAWTSAAILRRPCWRCSTRSRTRRSGTTISTCRSTSRGCSSSPPRT